MICLQSNYLPSERIPPSDSAWSTCIEIRDTSAGYETVQDPIPVPNGPDHVGSPATDRGGVRIG